MKNVTINTAAAWSGTFRSYQDGDIFRESNIDLQAGDLADRLGYLKAQVDGAATEAGNNTFTGVNAFNLDAGDLTITGASDLVITSGFQVNAASAFNAPVTCNDIIEVAAGIGLAHETLADAADTIAATTTHARVPALTASRIYTLPAAAGCAPGHTVILERVRTADAFTATLQDPTGPTTLGVISASNAGWIMAVLRGSSWRLGAWGGTVTSLDTTP